MDENRRVVLITGASAGIGQACAVYMQQQGYRVYGTSRFVKDIDTRFKMIQMGVDDDQSVASGVELILSLESRFDIVVNNAGYGLAGAFEETSIGEAKAQFETNFFGVMRVCKAALPIFEP